MGLGCRIPSFITGEAWTRQGSNREPRVPGREWRLWVVDRPLCVRARDRRRPWRWHKACWPLGEAEASAHGGYLLLWSPEG